MHVKALGFLSKRRKEAGPESVVELGLRGEE